MSFSGAALGIGGESPRIGQGRDRALKEGYDRLNAELAIEQAMQGRQRGRVQESNALAQLERIKALVAKQQEWKSIGSAKQMKNGTWAELQFQPESGQTRWQAVPNPEQGGGFDTPGDLAAQKSAGTTSGKIGGLMDAAKRGIPQSVIDQAVGNAATQRPWESDQGLVLIPNRASGGAPVQTNIKGRKRLRGGGGAGGDGSGGGDNAYATWAEGLRSGQVDNFSSVPKELKSGVLRYMQTHGETKGHKLNAMEQRQLDDTRRLKPFVSKIMAAIQSRGLQNANGWADSLAALKRGATYSLGRRPDDPIGQGITPVIAAVKVMGAAPWSSIGRGKYLFEEIQKHVPAFTDTPAMMYDKLRNLESIIDNNEYLLTVGNQGERGDAPKGKTVSPRERLP